MRHSMLTVIVMVALAMPVAPAFAQTTGRAATGSMLGAVTLTRKVMADGQPLAAGTYQVRLTGETLKPGVGQSPEGETYVEFLKGGKVVGREVATVVSSADIGSIAKWRKPPVNGVRVEMLKGNDYLRVWISRSGTPVSVFGYSFANCVAIALKSSAACSGVTPGLRRPMARSMCGLRNAGFRGTAISAHTLVWPSS